MVTKKLKCEACNGTMEIDSEKNILFCPYCGSKELIEYSDEVKKTQILADADIKKNKQNNLSKTEIIAIIIGCSLLALMFIGIIIACIFAVIYLK